MNHEAIYKLYPNAIQIIESEGTTTVYDELRNIIEIDTSAVDSWVNPEQYKYDRQAEYPSIQDQLDMQYWDAVNGTTTWKDAIAQVKADNPKPE